MLIIQLAAALILVVALIFTGVKTFDAYCVAWVDQEDNNATHRKSNVLIGALVLQCIVTYVIVTLLQGDGAATARSDHHFSAMIPAFLFFAFKRRIKALTAV